MRSDTENIYRQKVNQVIDYLSANLHKPLQLDTIADQINVSQRQLLRIMRSALHESLFAYVARQRVERAVLYMQTEEMSLAQLAEMVGYESPQSFSKAFKKQLGISPKTYMKELRARLESAVKSLFPPDCRIIARIGFSRECAGNRMYFVRFLSMIAVKYGFKHIGIESTNDKSRTFAKKLGFRSIDVSNYVVSVKELTEYFQISNKRR
jgi:AraC-like DNA-binding protein